MSTGAYRPGSALLRFLFHPWLTDSRRPSRLSADKRFTTRDIWRLTVLSLAGIIGCAMLIDRPLGRWLEALEPWSRPETIWISAITATIPAAILIAVTLVIGMALIIRMFLGPVEGIDFALPKACFILLTAIASGLSLPLKHLIGRARPFVMNDPFLFQPLSLHDALASFPSSQAALAGALATALSLVFPRFRLVFRSAGLAICASRVVSGEHWPSDVVAGWSIGMIAALVLWRRFGSRPPAADF